MVEQDQRCSFCGEPLVDEKSGEPLVNEITGQRLLFVESGGLDGKNPQILCERCINKAFRMIGGKEEVHNKKRGAVKNEAKSTCVIRLPENFCVMKPSDLLAKLEERILGQREYCKSLSWFGYIHSRRLQMLVDGYSIDRIPKKHNMFILGDTGVGKTWGATVLANIIGGLPVTIYDTTNLTEVGYVGESTDSILKKLLISSSSDIQLAQAGIAVLDEIDKTASKDTTTYNISRESVQEDLLKLVEGSELTTVTIAPTSGRYSSSKRDEVEFSTQWVSFLATGCFSSIYNQKRATSSIGFRHSEQAEREEGFDKNSLIDELVKYGMLRELLSRFNHFTVLNNLTVEDLERILVEPKDSVIKTAIELFACENIELRVTDAAIRKMAEEGFRKRLGARLAGEFYRLTRDVAIEVIGSKDVERVDIVVNNNGEIVAKTKRRGCIENISAR